jgi:glyoxylase I family protein
VIKNIHHIGIVVRDFEKMLKFYSEAFGFKVLGVELNIPKEKAEEISRSKRPRPNTRVIMMQAGNCYLEIMGNPDASLRSSTDPAAGYVQLCIDVDDIDAEYARLKEIGMTFGAPAAVDFGHVKAVTGCDPEGNVIELVQTIRDWDCNLAELLPTRV